MKIITYILVFFLFSIQVKGQLFVKNDSYVYVDNTFITVTSAVNLENTGNVYLRNDGQLFRSFISISGRNCE